VRVETLDAPLPREQTERNRRGAWFPRPAAAAPARLLFAAQACYPDARRKLKESIMSLEWTRHDDSTYFMSLGKALLVAVIYERLTPPGWKVQVGQRTLKDKFATLEDAQKVALAFADKVATAIRTDLDALKEGGGEAART
jgi:hypothetical protein